MNGSADHLDPGNYTKLYLNGSFVDAKSASKFSLLNPKDNSLVVDGIPHAGEEDIDIAVKNAEEALQGPWASFTAIQRTECFVKLGYLLEDRLFSILRLDSLSSGNPTSFAHNRDKRYIINTVKYYAGWTDKFKGEYLPADDGKDPSHLGTHVLSNKSRVRQIRPPRTARGLCCCMPFQCAGWSFDYEGSSTLSLVT